MQQCYLKINLLVSRNKFILLIHELHLHSGREERHKNYIHVKKRSGVHYSYEAGGGWLTVLCACLRAEYCITGIVL